MIRISSIVNLFVLVLVSMFAIGVAAQEEDKKSAEVETTSAELVASKKEAAPGETVLLKIILKLADGAHANSNSPADTNLIPTIFVPTKNENVEWKEIEYPEATEVIEPYSPEPLRVFEDGAEIKVRIEIKKSARKQALKIEGSLRVQVCDEQQCYPPKRIPLIAQIDVQDGKSIDASKN